MVETGREPWPSSTRTRNGRNPTTQILSLFFFFQNSLQVWIWNIGYPFPQIDTCNFISKIATDSSCLRTCTNLLSVLSPSSCTYAFLSLGLYFIHIKNHSEHLGFRGRTKEDYLGTPSSHGNMPLEGACILLKNIPLTGNDIYLPNSPKLTQERIDRWFEVCQK